MSVNVLGIREMVITFRISIIVEDTPQLLNDSSNLVCRTADAINVPYATNIRVVFNEVCQLRPVLHMSALYFLSNLKEEYLSIRDLRI